MQPLAPLAALVLFASACTNDSAVAPGGPGDPEVPAGQLSSIAILDPGNVSDGDVLHLRAEVRDRLGHVVSNLPTAWTSSDTTVAVVSGTGVLTALRAGAVELEASAENAFGKVLARRVVTVSLHPAAALLVSDAELSLPIGQVRGVHATLHGADGRILLHRVLAWTSADPSVAWVTSTGEILAVAAGSTVIAVRYGALSAEVRVQVPAAPALSRYDVTSVNGQPLPVRVDDWIDSTATGPRRLVTRIESGALRMGDPYDVRLQLVSYEVTGLGGNTIVREVGRATITDVGTVWYDWLTGAATLRSTRVGGLEHPLRDVAGTPVLYFRQAGTDMIWELGLTYVP